MTSRTLVVPIARSLLALLFLLLIVSAASDRAAAWAQENPRINVEKKTNGHDADHAPGPTINVGDPVTWTYRVENTGDVRLSSITVTDDQEGAVSCPKSSLNPGESMTCSGSGTAVAGQYSNVGTAEGTSPGGTVVSDTDPSHYWGRENPSIDVEKKTNGHDADLAPGPTIEVGDAVTWTYRVENTGDVRLSTITVTDDQEGAVSCPKSSLNPGESMTCTGSGTAVAGQYSNVGTAEGASPGGATVSDDNPSHYYGSTPIPVELMAFEGVQHGTDVLLRWSTASETNNAGFSVERRAARGERWKQVAFVAGHGTTTEPQTYQHRLENLDPGTHRFRLKQIDFDGAFEYSPEVEVTVEMAEHFLLAPVYPNPFNPTATVRFAVREAVEVRVALYDALGREVAVLYAGTPAGGEMVEAQIDGRGLVSGLYVVRLTGAGIVATQTVTLMK